MDRLAIGVVSNGVVTDLALAGAAARHPSVALSAVAPDESGSTRVVGVIVDVPVKQRAAVVRQAADRWQVPILVESPVGLDSDAARGLVEYEHLVVAANPLRYGLHTGRLIEELQGEADPIQTFFAAWRFRASSPWEPALPQLLDYLQAVCPGSVRRVSAMSRHDPFVLSVTLRYASGALGSLEIGEHLPVDFPVESELVIECFCSERSYHCLPGAQAVSVVGRVHGQYDWQPEPVDAIVSSFVHWLCGGPRPVGDLNSDLGAAVLSEQILRAAASGVVLD